jgi:Heterokaryon incompatibility protein (HET)
MDHLPTPLTPFHDPIEIPYINNPSYLYVYDDKDFFSFPASMKWDKVALAQGNFGGRSPEEASAFLQAWLYFGLLHEVISFDGVTLVNDADYIRVTDDGRKVITTATLLNDLRIWASFWENSNVHPDERHAHRRAVDNILEEAHGFVQSLLRSDAPERGLSPHLGLSLMVLGETLTAAKNSVLVTSVATAGSPSSSISVLSPHSPYEHVLRRTDSVRGRDQTDKFWDWSSSALVDNMLSSANWCDSEIAMLREATGVGTMYFASNLRRYTEVTDHSECTALCCVAYNVVEGTYLQKHTDECDGKCPEVGIDVEGTSIMLERQDIPVFRFCGTGNLQPHSAISAERYVAISHVWKDGLGNPSGNIMHACQITRIQKLIDSLYDNLRPVYFWIDTLCVPVHHKNLRNLAIRSMHKTYSQANRVLVLDSELQQVTMDISYQEALLRIRVSGWMRRLWTLQEGALAKQLFFQFREGVKSLSSILDAVIEDPSARLDKIPSDLTSELLRLPCILSSQGSRRLTAVSFALRWRTTSRLDDEPLCISTLLNLDVSEILKCPSRNERMKKIWELEREFPRSIAFTDAPRFSDDRFRWCPKSLMESIESLTSSATTAQWAPGQQGLLFHGDGILFDDIFPSTGPIYVSLPDPYPRSYLFAMDGATAEKVQVSGNDKRYAIILAGFQNSAQLSHGLVMMERVLLVERQGDSLSTCPCGHDERCVTANFVQIAVLAGPARVYDPESQTTLSRIAVKGRLVRNYGWIVR